MTEFERFSIRRVARVVAVTFAFFAAYLLSLFVSWLARHYPTVTMHDIMFHARMPLTGTGADPQRSFVLECLLPSVALTALTARILAFLRRLNRRAGWVERLRRRVSEARRWPPAWWPRVRGPQSHVPRAQPSSQPPPKATRSRLSAARGPGFALGVAVIGFLAVSSIVRLERAFAFFDYLRDSAAFTLFYDEHYIDPNYLTFQVPEKPRNLIVIMVESLESSFLPHERGGFFDESVMPHLERVADDNLTFGSGGQSGSVQLVGTSWTVAGLVSQTFGLPLVVPMLGDWAVEPDAFLLHAIGLTDILADAGYQQRFLMGSDKAFGGRDLLFEQHGAVDIRDLNYYRHTQRIAEDEFVWWGFDDETLFALAREELDDLASREEPFNLMLLTVDTHHPLGYLNENCPQPFERRFDNVLYCAAQRISGFLDWAKDRPWYEDTLIVVAGDHLYMDEDIFDVPPAREDRRIFNTFLNVPVQGLATERRYSSLDIFPTIVDGLGIGYDAEGLGLGRSLLRSAPTLVEQFGVDYLNDELPKRSVLYRLLVRGEPD